MRAPFQSVVAHVSHPCALRLVLCACTDMRTPASSGSESLGIETSGAGISLLDLNGKMAELYILLVAMLAVGAGAIAGDVRRAVRAIHVGNII